MPWKDYHCMKQPPLPTDDQIVTRSFETLHRLIATELSRLTNANKNRVLLALQSTIGTQLDALETDTHD